jgi:hypothetical protein
MKELTPTQQLAQLQQAAIEYDHARAMAFRSGSNHEERMTAVAAVRANKPRPVNGLEVNVVEPRNVTVYRRPHIRFSYRLNGKRCNETAALAALGQ